MRRVFNFNKKRIMMELPVWADRLGLVWIEAYVVGDSDLNYERPVTMNFLCIYSMAFSLKNTFSTPISKNLEFFPYKILVSARKSFLDFLSYFTTFAPYVLLLVFGALRFEYNMWKILRHCS
jgi:hypothetical protein